MTLYFKHLQVKLDFNISSRIPFVCQVATCTVVETPLCLRCFIAPTQNAEQFCIRALIPYLRRHLGSREANRV